MSYNTDLTISNSCGHMIYLPALQVTEDLLSLLSANCNVLLEKLSCQIQFWCCETDLQRERLLNLHGHWVFFGCFFWGFLSNSSACLFWTSVQNQSTHCQLPSSAYCILAVFAHTVSLCTRFSWRPLLVTLAANMLEQPGVMKAWGGISWWQELWGPPSWQSPSGSLRAESRRRKALLSLQERGMKYELLLISHLITVLTSAVSYLLQECRGIWIIST